MIEGINTLRRYQGMVDELRDSGHTDQQIVLALLIEGGDRGVSTWALRRSAATGNPSQRVRELEDLGIQFLQHESVRVGRRSYAIYTLAGRCSTADIDRIGRRTKPVVAATPGEPQNPAAVTAATPVPAGGDSLFNADAFRGTGHHQAERAA